MLPRSRRLTTAHFNEVIKRGRTFHSPLFLVRILPVAGETTRIAAAVPVKVAKAAVARNALRRKMYEAAQPFLASVKEGSQVIVFAKAALAEKHRDIDISADLKALFVKAGLLR